MLERVKSEGDISREIQGFLNEIGIEWFWRNQVYKGRVKSGAYLHTGKKGIADIIIVAFGFTSYVELKDGKGKQTDDQKAFQLHCLENGQPYIVVRSVSDLEDFIEDLRSRVN